MDAQNITNHSDNHTSSRSTFNTRRWLVKRFLALCAPTLAIVALGFVIFNIIENNIASTLLRNNETLHVTLAKEIIDQQFETVTSDVLFLARSSGVAQLVDDDVATGKAEIVKTFLNLMTTRKLYDQVRFIDDTGEEIVRTNFHGGAPAVVPTSQLQNKSQRYYFTDTLQLNFNQLFVSPLDLNMEQGQIEYPIKPMLRFGTPVFDRQQRKRGIVLVNYFGQLLLEQIRRALQGSKGEPMLLNIRSYWLLAPNPRDEWGFMFNNERTFARDFPAEWIHMVANEEGQFTTEHGLFTFTTYYPLRPEQLSSTGSSEAYAPSKTPVDAQDYYWKIVSRIDPRQLPTFFDYRYFAFFSLLVAFIVPGSWIVASAQLHNRETSESLRLSAKIIDATAEGVIITGADRRILEVNHAFIALTGYTLMEILNKESTYLLTGQEGAEFHRQIWTTLDEREHWQGQIWVRQKSDQHFPAWISISTLRDDVHRITHYVAIFSDISERVEAEQRITHMAQHDALTGLPNRSLLFDRLNQGLIRAKRNHQRVGILFIDLDGFKTINDNQGHDAGDATLREVAKRLKEALRAMDTVARIGGDEFVVILQELPAMETGAWLAQKLIDAVSGPIHLSSTDVQVSASVGISFYPEDGENADGLLSKADTAMYQAKTRGKGIYCLYRDMA